MPIDAALHARTPTIIALEPRGLDACKVAYDRRVASDVAKARIERVERDAAGRADVSWDARLPIPCRRNRYALSGTLVRSAHVDSGWSVVLYGAANEPVHAWDARGAVSRFLHDDMGRPVAAHEGIGTTRCLERLLYGMASDDTGAAGRLIRHDDTGGTLQVASYSVHGGATVESRRYLLATDEPDWPEAIDERDRLLESETFESRWRHDARGAPWHQIDAGGHVRRYVFDIAGRPAALHIALEGVAEQTVSTGTNYDAEGHVTARRDGVVETIATFDPASGHQLGLLRTVAGRAIQDLAYEYDGVGNVTTMEDVARATDWFDPAGTDPLHRYDYDTLDRLIRATGRESVRIDGAGGQPPVLTPGAGTDNPLRDYIEDYDYDTGGNLLAMAHKAAGMAVVRHFTIEAGSNRAVPVDEEGEIAFDATGNRLQLHPGVPLTWDLRGRLAGVGPTATLDERYIYDAGGMRTRKSTSTGEVRYLPGMERRTGPGGSSCDILHLPWAGGLTRIVHWRTGKPPSETQDLQRIQVADLLGSVCLETTADGTVLSEETFHPFGSPSLWAARDASTAKGKVRHYSGKETDATGLSYYGHRYYAAWLGRWISPDPAGDIDGLNRYRFTRNNPCSGTDREGYMFEGLRRRASTRMRGRAGKMSADHAVANALVVGRESVHDYLRSRNASIDIDAGLKDAVDRVARAQRVLLHAPRRGRPVVAAHLGLRPDAFPDNTWEETRSTLLDGFQQIQHQLQPLGAKTDGTRGDGDGRVVLLSSNIVSGIPEQASAFVYESDPGHRIFLHSERLLSHATAETAVNIFLHEPTHLFPNGGATKDIRYFSEQMPALQSRMWAASYVPPEAPLSVSDKSPQAQAIRRIGSSYAGMSVSEKRRRMVLQNADSWRVIISSLSTQDLEAAS